MKRLSFLAMFIAMVLSASAQYYMHVWSDGATYSMPVLNVDSVTFTDGPLENVPNEPQEPAQGIGVFSVGEGKTVTFSPGNLQYTQSTNTWSFASAQWEMIGTDNVTGGSVSLDESGYFKSGTALADKIDLFGWSTSATNFGVSTSEDNNDYSGSFIEWGTNKIGNDAPNTWRTLTIEECSYLIYYRTNAYDLFGVAQVNGVNGLILLPDNWICPAGVTFKSGEPSEHSVEAYGQYQAFTADQWSKLESAGAVFLPAAGRRYGSGVERVQFYGYYWSATECGSSKADYLYFYSRQVDAVGSHYRYYGQSVRLVKDVEGGGATPDTPDTPDTPTEPEEPTNPSAGIGTFSVSADKQVTFSQGNLQYTQSTNKWSFAENQWDLIGNANVIDDVLADKVDLFGWSTSANNFGVSTSEDSNDYSGSFIDWGTNQIGADAPNTWRTLTYNEWEYLLYSRPNASSLRGVAQVNGVNGLILLPDNWTCPEGVTFKSGFHSSRGVDYYVTYQTFTADQWSKMESVGAIFLPAAGYRVGTYVDDVHYHGSYWSATSYNGLNCCGVWDLCFHSDKSDMGDGDNILGLSVRLVKDL